MGDTVRINLNIKELHIAIFEGSFKTTAFIRRLVIGLIASGHQVTIIGFNEDNPNPISKVNYQSLGSNHSKLKMIGTSLQLALRSKDMGIMARTLRLLAKGNRKPLQAHNLHLVFKKLNPDIVHVQWPSLLPWMEPYLPNDQCKVILSQRGYHNNVRPFVDVANFQYLQHWYPKLDGLHSVSEAISEKGKIIGIPSTQIDKVVYSGLNLKKLKYKAENKKGKKLNLLSVGRPHWIKDYPTALKACALLKKKNIDFQYTIIGGQGNEELQFLIDQFKLRDTIFLTDKIPQNQVYKEMRMADVLLITSIEEGLPNVAVEAMALGLPVISTDCGGVEELIIDDMERWLVPIRNPKALATAIAQLKNLSLEQINTITLAARAKVEQQHTVEKMVNDMEKIYFFALKSL